MKATMRTTALSLAALAFAAAAPAAFASGKAQAAAPAAPRVISVEAEGTAPVAHDVAVVRLGVETRSPSVKEAFALNRASMQKVLDAVRAAGVAEKDAATVDFSVYFERPYPVEKRDGKDEGEYRVMNAVAITVRDRERIGAVIDAAVDAGANQMQGIQFGASDVGQAESTARVRAVEKAREKAETLALAAGVKIAGVESVEEVATALPGPANALRMKAMAFADSGPSPVEAGTGEVLVGVRVVFRLE